MYKYEQQKKIYQVLCWIDKSTTVRFNTVLQNSNKSSHREVMYRSNKGDEYVNIGICAYSYVSIESKGFNINMKDSDLYSFVNALETWYNILDMEYDEWFAKVDDSYILRKEASPLQIECLYGDTMVILPCILFKPNETVGGIEININDPKNKILLDINKILEVQLRLNCVMNNFPLMEMLNMNYIGRPEYGFNMFKMNSNM